MASIVRDLQREAMDSSASLADLLRKALVVARKLGIQDIQEQLTHEMNGYPDDSKVPPYRIVHGEIKAWNPYNGWIPYILKDPETAQMLTTTSVKQPVGTLEMLLNSSVEGELQMSFSTERRNWLMRDMDVSMQPKLHIGRSQIHGILEAVRNVILDWSLKLEEQDIPGEGLTFTSQEKQKAAAVVYNINPIR